MQRRQLRSDASLCSKAGAFPQRTGAFCAKLQDKEKIMAANNYELLKKIKESLHSFSQITDIPVTFRDAGGAVTWECRKECKVCCSNQDYYNNDFQCSRTFNTALKVARELGEVYTFLCDSGLINLIYACYDGEILLGYFIAGPIAMGQDHDKVISKFYSRLTLSKIDVLVLMNTTSRMKMYTPMETTYLTNIFMDCIKAHMPADSDLRRNMRNIEQSLIATRIVELKKSNIEIQYPSEAETVLTKDILECRSAELHKHIMKYLEDFMIYDAGDVSVIRLRLIVLFTRLTKSLQTAEEIDSSILEMEALSNASSLKELTNAAIEYAEFIIKETMKFSYQGDSVIVNQAIRIIQEKCSSSLQLQDIAGELHVNKSYLSTLFRKETGKNVTEYINDVRLDRAAEELRNTNTSVTDIAFRCGFESQSYFTKLFRQKYDMTPSRYRKQS